jgi:hypothetical protein
MRGIVNLTDEKFFNQKGAKFFRLFVQRILQPGCPSPKPHLEGF